MSWIYKRYVAIAGTTDDPTRFLTVMKNTKKDARGAAMTFTGPTLEAVDAKISEFWKAEAEKKGNRAAGRVKTEATKAQKEST